MFLNNYLIYHQFANENIFNNTISIFKYTIAHFVFAEALEILFFTIFQYFDYLYYFYLMNLNLLCLSILI